MMSRRWLFLPLALCLGLAAFFLWYGLTTPLSPQSALASAYTTTTGLQSAHIVMEQIMQTSQEGRPVTRVWYAEGDFQFPDRMQMTTRYDGQDMEMVTIGRKVYTRSAGQSTWQVQNLPPFVPVSFADVPAPDLKSMLEQMKMAGNVEQLPDEEIDGVLCLRYRWQVDFGRARQQFRQQLNAQDPEVKTWLETLDRMEVKSQPGLDYWLGKQDHLVRQFRMHYVFNMPMPSGPAGGVLSSSPYSMTLTVRFSDFNQPVYIQPPVESSP
jgi:hypothetical protein